MNNQDLSDFRLIKMVRHARNKTLTEMSLCMNVDRSVISRLENGSIAFSPLYQSKFEDSVKQLRISNIELISMQRILEMKEMREKN